MKNRLKTMSGALALTFMLLLGAAFAGTADARMVNPNTSAEGLASARNDRLWVNHHRHREYRHMRHDRRWGNRGWRRDHR